jgi:hypothetical protein
VYLALILAVVLLRRLWYVLVEESMIFFCFKLARVCAQHCDPPVVCNEAASTSSLAIIAVMLSALLAVTTTFAH